MKASIPKRAVDALPAGKSIADQEMPGFVVRRLPSGRLSYGYRYTKDGRRRWITIGVGITPHDARKAAKRLAGNVASDRDPLPERETRRLQTLSARPTDQVLDDFLTHVRVRQLRSADEMESLLQCHIRPKLGSRRINELSAPRSSPFSTRSPLNRPNGLVTACLAAWPTGARRTAICLQLACHTG